MPQFSRTWWGQRFIEALERFTDSARLGRGRTYANTGRIVEHAVTKGKVSARVRGSINPYYGVYKEPIYITTIAVTPFTSAQWSAIIQRITARADLVTKLLQQEVPDRIDEAFEDQGLHLLPHGQKDFTTDCSCPDYSNPCKHIAGVCYRLASDLDRDPFLLFVLRGLSREDLQAELVKSPLGEVLAASLTSESVAVEPVESFFTRPTRTAAAEITSHRAFWSGGRLPPPEPLPGARVPALLVKKQGDYPPFWHRDNSFIEIMEEIYGRVRTKSPEMK